MTTTVKNETAASYSVTPAKIEEDQIIRQAISIIESRARKFGFVVDNPSVIADYFVIRLSEQKQEVFSVAYLNNQHQLIECIDEFRGTINGSAVHPREIVRHAIELNAAAVVVSHNHPSGMAEPSHADIMITRKLKEALKLIDVEVLDHIVVAHGGEWISLAQRGEI